MTFEDFEVKLIEVKRAKPLLFELEADKAPSEQEVADCERILGITLPSKYVYFVQRYGGGYFGYANIYSLDPSSCYYLLNHNQHLQKPALSDAMSENSALILSVLFIADNGCGDLYALTIEDGKCLDEVKFYNHEDNTLTPTPYADLLEYLLSEGLKV